MQFMGNSVSFFGFSSEPDVTKLDKLAWLRGWTLFSEAEVPAWYLEGPNATSEITFFEPLRTEKFAPDTNILTLAQTITSKIEEALGYTTLFRVDQFFQCAALSKVLGQTAICVLGDDEGLGAFNLPFPNQTANPPPGCCNNSVQKSNNPTP